MLFDRTEALEERLVALVKGGTWDPEWLDSLDLEAEIEATLLLSSFALSGMVAAQWLIPVENFSLLLEVLLLRK